MIWQLGIAARLPMAKEINDFDFEGSLINETLIWEMACILDRHRLTVKIGHLQTGRHKWIGQVPIGLVDDIAVHELGLYIAIFIEPRKSSITLS